MKAGWRTVALGEVVSHRNDFIEIDDLKNYKRCRVKLHAQGVQLRDVLPGALIKTKKQQLCVANDFLVAEIDAKVGGFGIVPESLEGAIVSSHYFLFAADRSALDYRFLGYYARTKRFRDQVSARGSTNYAAIRPSHVLNYTIPLPPLADQLRIVAHLDAIEEQLARVLELRAALGTETQALTISLHHQLAKDRITKLSDLIKLDEEQEAVKPDGSYPQVGIRSFGAGMFRKPATEGTATTYRAFNVLRAGKLVMSQVKGWEGAVAVCPPDLDGWYVSPEYRTFSCRDEACDSNYLAFIIRTRWFQKHLASATRGVGARRERIHPEMLLELQMPFPDIGGQQVGVSTLARLHQTRAISEEVAPLSDALLPSLLDRVFNG